MVDNGQADSVTSGLSFLNGLAKLADDFLVGGYREAEGDLHNGAAGAPHVGLDGFLDGAVGVVQHEDDVALLEGSVVEGPGGLLEDDGGGGGGVVDEGDLVHVVGVDQVLDDGSGAEKAGLEVVEVELVRLAEVLELPVALHGDDGGRAAAEGAVVEARHGGVVVGEFRLDLGVGDEISGF